MTGAYGQRLEKALLNAGKSRADLSKVLRSPKTGELGVSASSVGQVINGTSSAFSAENSARAARYLRVSPFWLATGEGTMQDHTARVVIAAEPQPAYLTDEELLVRFGMLLASLPKHLCAPFAALLADWALSAGADDRRAALDALLALRGPHDAKR